MSSGSTFCIFRNVKTLTFVTMPPFSLLLLLTAWLRAAEAKKFVICVGPHETHTGTTSFLSKYAADDGSGVSSFDGWSWPIIKSDDIDTTPQHVFDLLVKEQDDDDIQNILIDGIRSAWTASKHGVFIGSLDFDRVGANPYSGYDAIESLIQVVDEVGISAEDVTVIVTYRTPRVNQWGMIWENHFDAESYEDFVCSNEQHDKRWEWLDTSMNPFKVAKSYHDQKWNVVVVDQDSIIKAGKDVANVIACFVMENENCEGGQVNGLEEMTPKTSLADKIDELDAEDLSDLERLFLFRDCFYVTQLDDSSRFEMFAKNSDFDLIQSECKNSFKKSYAKLSDTDFLMNAIQSQKYCEKDDIDVPSLLTEISESKIDGSFTDDEFIESYESIKDESDSFDDESESEADDDEADDNDEDDEFSSSTDDYKNDPMSSSNDGSNKKLVVFVGPHETEAIDVTKFFVNYASANEDDEPLESFDGWSWPLIDDEIIWKPAHRVFDLLITDPDTEDIQRTVIDGIVETWKNSKNGVIIGSLYFDRVGTNPYSHYDPIGALHRVVDALGISNKDVTVTVTYRSPRIDHWSVVWNNHFDSNDYEHFICSDGEESAKRWEWLDTVMNPFKIAKTYHDQGWNVAVVDQEGTINAGMDLSHTIACNLMEDVNCKNGWIDGLDNIASEPLAVIPMNSMEEEGRHNLEQLFRERDCYFKYDLKDKPGFAILNQHSAWSSCSGQHKAFYKQFTDTNFMLNLLKSQKQCGESNVDISNILEKKMVHSDNKQLIIFAGPHETSAVPVNKFFVDHASDKEGTNRSTSLDGWIWPIIDSEILGNTQSHRIFDLLLSDADTRPVQNVIMDGIRDSWNKAQNGVIIGSLDFDRVGENPYSSYDALGAVDRVVQTLGIPDNDVTVVLNYRSRRLDHLSAVWWNHFDAESFQDFVCSDAQADKRWEWMDTVMNPLKLANAYIEEGWNVAMIDQEGTSIAGKDVAHAVACGLMNDVDCDNGWVRGLKSETIDAPLSYEIDALNDIQRTKLEILFRMRDCFYKYALESDNKFSTVNRNELWKSCLLKDRNKFEKLADTDFLLEVMRSLQGCGDISNLGSSSFASELLKSDTVFASKSHSTVIIATVFLSAVVIVFFGILMKERKREKSQKTKESPTEGIFKDDPPNIGIRESSYRDNESAADESMDEFSFDGDDGENFINNMGEAIDAEDLPSNRDEDSNIV